MSFVNLHAHSHYSLLDGFGSPRDMILRCKELGYPAAALTDHGVTYGLLEFYQEGKKEGVKPILGCEMYVSRRSRFDKEAKIDIKPYHLTVLAKNRTGYGNLLKLTSLAHLEGFYYKPRVDYDLLRKYNDGLVVMSGCMAAHLPRTILDGTDEDARKVVEMYIDIFGKENYFLEVQDHPLFEDQNIVNARLKVLAKDYDLKLVATNDSHYPRPEDSEIHDILLCIQTGSTVHDENRMRYTGDFSIRAIDDLRAGFKDLPGAVDNTLLVADMCSVDFEFGENLIPSFDVPNGKDYEVYLRELCEQGLIQRFFGKDVPSDYRERLDYELALVHKMGFDTYFLIVGDFVKYAKDKGIVVGPGRGSAAGSIIAWCLKITDVDPIGYGLFFERFLNPERVSMPDIDIDFSDHRRGEVLDYVVNKYGRDNVAQIITFGTMAPRAAVRDTGRALGYPYAEVDQLAKIVPPPVLGKHTPLEESIVSDKDLKSIYESDQRARDLLDYAKKLEGTVRHVGTHACAVVISEKPLTQYTALQHGASSDKEIVTQFSAGPLESLGLLKMDFLGLRNLTIIEKTEELVMAQRGEKITIEDIPLDDEQTFALLQRGDTTGVFQLESPGMRRYLKELKPTCFEDIVAMGALYRPGPMEWIPTYIKGKHNPGKVKYLHKSFKGILESTYGVAVYQEQILQLARDFAGFSLGEADILRKAVGKKIASLLAEQREKFVAGAVLQGHDKKFAEEVFEKIIEPFAGYGFNRAHAVCYGMIAYQTAYLKAHYPIEFMTSLLYSDAGNTDRVVLEIKECNEMGIKVLPPSVNESFGHFAICAENTIRFGLLSIKGVGDGPVDEIIGVRNEGGPFTSLEDFAKRVPNQILNKKLIQALARSGAFDEFGDRNRISESFAEISKYAKDLQKSADSSQTDIFGLVDEDESTSFPLQLIDIEKASQMQHLAWERELIGMYVSGHPLKGLGKYLIRKINLIGNLTKKHLNQTVKLVGLVSELRRIVTKNGDSMAIFVLEDNTARLSAVMFPRDFAKFGSVLVEGRILSVSGNLNNRRDQYQVVCESAKGVSMESMIANAKEAGLFDPDEVGSGAVRLLDDILSDNSVSGDEDDEEIEVLSDNSSDDSVADPSVVDPYLISIPSGASSDLLKELKDLLLRSKGKTPVELNVPGSSKRIKLPIEISVTPDLEGKIMDLLK